MKARRFLMFLNHQMRDMVEADERLHDGELPGVIELQSWNRSKRDAGNSEAVGGVNRGLQLRCA